jgi:hemolysin III
MSDNDSLFEEDDLLLQPDSSSLRTSPSLAVRKVSIRPLSRSLLMQVAGLGVCANCTNCRPLAQTCTPIAAGNLGASSSNNNNNKASNNANNDVARGDYNDKNKGNAHVEAPTSKEGNDISNTNSEMKTNTAEHLANKGDVSMENDLQNANNNDDNNNTNAQVNTTDTADTLQAREDPFVLNLPELRRQRSSMSPLVVAPMLQPNPSLSTTVTESILSHYILACRFYGCPTNAGVLTTIRFGLPSLRVSGSFHDADVLALVEVLMPYMNGPLQYIRRLDFTLSTKGRQMRGRHGFRSHGALALSKALQESRYIEQVYMLRNPIGPYGATALFLACFRSGSSNNGNKSRLHTLNLRRCRIGARGALALAELLATTSPNATSLRHVDLTANNLGVQGCYAIERALNQRMQEYGTKEGIAHIEVDLEGNLVFPEIMNGVTHGLGVLMAIAAAFLLQSKVQGWPTRYVVSCGIYSTSLIVLYISSTLFHSFFTLRYTKYVFEVMDKCAIYILIAGSYTPFLQIVLYKDAFFSTLLFYYIWSCCALGIGVEAFYPVWKYKGYFSLLMYLGMGWSALICLPRVNQILPWRVLELMVLGGVAYTAGVPFFVRNNNLDHALWHLFVLAGSIFHWCANYWYVVNFVPQGETIQVGNHTYTNS